MKVLHIITGLADGGAEAVLFRLITHDTKNQHVVVSLTTEAKYRRRPKMRLDPSGLRQFLYFLRRFRQHCLVELTGRRDYEHSV